MLKKVYIDGQEGTTGLKIIERLESRKDIEIIKIDEDLRKDSNERKKLINQSDYTFLCLPDVASIEAVSFVENENVKIIDASTAHRTNSEWAYGFPELSLSHRQKIAGSKRVAVPGCYASGFLALSFPLVTSGVMQKDFPVTCHALSGYSGAGKSAIKVYEDENRPLEYSSPRQYALGQQHKHLKEMKIISGLEYNPMFNPIICDYFNGMIVSIPIHTRLLKEKITAKKMYELFCKHYENQHFVKVMPFMGEGVLTDGFIAANTLANTNDMQIFICGHDEQIFLSARLDNLGKGASGAAVQCMNIMMGIDEKTGLE